GREGCTYRFADDDEWQVWTEALYRRPDTGEEWTMQRLPAGAMFDATWRHDTKGWVGPDGMSLTVVLPQGYQDSRSAMWCVDGPASGGGQLKFGAWSRTGDPKANPPTVSATPSINAGTAGEAGHYHGFLTKRTLTD